MNPVLFFTRMRGGKGGVRSGPGACEEEQVSFFPPVATRFFQAVANGKGDLKEMRDRTSCQRAKKRRPESLPLLHIERMEMFRTRIPS